MHAGSHLLIELGLVIFGLGALARLADKISLSPIPLYLLAGLAFGSGGIVPLVTTQSFIEVAAEIGVILLLLTLGLEYSAQELMSSLRANRSAGMIDIALNFTPGFVAGLLLGWEVIPAIVLGGITYVTSSGIVSKVLRDMGRLANRETPVVLSILVMEDLAMAGALPVITGLVVGGGLAESIIPVSFALASAGLILFAALRYGRTISSLIASPNDEILVLLVLGLALIVAGVAESAHVSAGVGAFLVGIALSDKVASGAQTILKPMRDLFSAVFFVFFGLSTDPSTIPSVLLPALGLAVVTAGTKVGTGWLATRGGNFDTRARLRAGVAIIARGEFSIVLAGIAVNSDIEPQLGPLAATYVLLLATTGPLLSRMVANDSILEEGNQRPTIEP